MALAWLASPPAAAPLLSFFTPASPTAGCGRRRWSISATVIALTTVLLIVLDRAYGLDRLLIGRGSEEG